MNRKKGISLVASGVVLACVTLLGAFALISDTADTGTLSVETASQDTALNLKIHDTEITSASTNCASLAAGGYIDNQTIAPLTLTGANPSSTLTRYVCVHNTGTQPSIMSLALLNTQDDETGCTGDEALTDTSCGSGAGELADDVDVVVTQMGVAATSSVACNETAQTPAVSYDGVADSASPAAIGGSIPALGYSCYRIVATYDATTPAGEVQDNQTDKVSWQHRFEGSLT